MADDRHLTPYTDEVARRRIAAALIREGIDTDDGPSLFQWHPCTDQPACEWHHGQPCPCAGRPYLSDEAWACIRSELDLGGRLLPDQTVKEEPR
jgi:hypothetical protein